MKTIEDKCGAFIERGVQVEPLDTEKKWPVKMLVKKGDLVFGGTIIAQTPETPTIMHKAMVPPNVSAKIIEAGRGWRLYHKRCLDSSTESGG